MSAFIVDKATIDLLIGAGLELPEHGPLRWNASADPQLWQPRSLTRADAHEVGIMLWAECLASVAHRYPDDEPTELPGPYGFSPEQLLGYRYRPLPGRVPPLAVLSVAQGYEYQSNEHPGWQSSEARRFVQALTGAAIRALPGFAVQPWVIGEGERAMFA